MVNKKQTYQDDFRMHLKSLSVFLLFMLASFLTFFCLIQKDVTENTEAIIINNVDRQSIHFTDTITLHFEYFEGIASHFAASDDLLSENNLQLLESVKEQSSLELLAVITPDGTSTYSNGMQKSVASRRYFQEAIAGHRALSAPIISKVDNKTTRIILAVPICRGDNVIGVIGGSCDVSSLSKMLFGDIYDGAGSILILNSEGEIISCTMEKDNSGVQPEDNFFRYYSATKFREGVTLETESRLRQSSGFFSVSRRTCSFRKRQFHLLYGIPAAEAQRLVPLLHCPCLNRPAVLPVCPRL